MNCSHVRKNHYSIKDRITYYIINWHELAIATSSSMELANCTGALQIARSPNPPACPGGALLGRLSRNEVAARGHQAGMRRTNGTTNGLGSPNCTMLWDQRWCGGYLYVNVLVDPPCSSVISSPTRWKDVYLLLFQLPKHCAGVSL